jgi:hypothetical protein
MAGGIRTTLYANAQKRFTRIVRKEVNLARVAKEPVRWKGVPGAAW